MVFTRFVNRKGPVVWVGSRCIQFRIGRFGLHVGLR